MGCTNYEIQVAAFNNFICWSMKLHQLLAATIYLSQHLSSEIFL